MLILSHVLVRAYDYRYKAEDEEQNLRERTWTLNSDVDDFAKGAAVSVGARFHIQRASAPSDDDCAGHSLDHPSPPNPFFVAILVKTKRECLWYVSLYLNDSRLFNYSQIHALVARGSVILAEHRAGERDFSQGTYAAHHSDTYRAIMCFIYLATQTILSKIPPNNSKLTYVWEQYLFHYVSEDGITYLVMADDSVGRRVIHL